MSALQAELMDMTKDLSEETLQLLIGMVRQFIIPMENRAAMAGRKRMARERIGFMKDEDFVADGYDIDEYNPEIAKLFGVADV